MTSELDKSADVDKGPDVTKSPAREFPGAGLVKGLATTFKTMTRHAHTVQYPDQPPELPPRTRGVIALLEENCTVCMLCARECPDWCIYIDSHKETIPAPPGGGRERTRNVLDRFAIDFSLCMYCGICIEVCPFDALEWSPEFEYAEFDIKDLLHEKDRLREWFWTVPAPVALDPAAEEPKEIAAAQKAADKLLAAQKAAEIVALAEPDAADSAGAGAKTAAESGTGTESGAEGDG
ncbi:MAG TPA: NADH-quinone oxidoreductase subunit I [Actinocrinis sp.]|nr:NADH-quinone oxidoreductase subunit I [Actinocrinis sp.]HZP51560.1 NADH-quinone oxidoreductase subunit I [Actinocrinis sp.]